ncbi:putative purine permease 4 [Stylosanthes scabra]|uniref:Probable purine permease n=1 Tax=Stylosanthes scabra TaxID=79078 RepID=A0ABU6T532_9FABA|nr:putative purine permease 4 [Stylosanthes scabra]
MARTNNNYESLEIETINIQEPTTKEQEQPQSHMAAANNNNNKAQQLHAAATTTTNQKSITNKRYMPLLVLNYLLLFVGSVSSSMLSKYYFNHKGSSKWVLTWVQCAGFPFLIIPIFLPYSLLKSTSRKPFTDFTTKILTLSIFVGIMLGINNFLISWGVFYLPVSTSSLLLSTQLVFNLILSVIIVKQKINFSNLNTVILITLSSVILALNSSTERPEGVTQKQFFIGFFCIIGAGFLFALYLPVVEKIYRKVYCYEMVMEMQLVMEVAATALATLGMAFDGGFSEMRREGREVFDKGETVYWVTIVATIVTWQCCFMGTAGMVFLTSSLTGGICMTALLSMNVLGGVVFFRDKFGGFKGVATVLCLWGFCSYVYGMYTKMLEAKKAIHDQNKKDTSEDLELVGIVNNHGVSH